MKAAASSANFLKIHSKQLLEKRSIINPIMSSVLARTGRHRQRYENNFRLVSGCIPYRITEDINDEDHSSSSNTHIENKIQVLMVSSPDRDDRVFPKGGWEDDETVLEAACREAFEESGVKGTLRETPLGVWEFRSKSRQNMCSLEGGCRGYMFALEVTEELDTWPEQQNRDREWLNIKEAFRVCRYEWMRRALEQFLRVMASDKDDDDDGTVGKAAVVPADEVVVDDQIMNQMTELSGEYDDHENTLDEDLIDPNLVVLVQP
ncbi:putative diadenosine hexaphosphate hydrolase (AMP-forming) [Rosa chinensis]|uniref:Putative diadenosine hexaphosphate hydrolase (AMP-forming) n=1 Tax=Rosa chinensis TaxID=74649 RepID=A0A2P6S6P9_ROSCH|nr:nudix hydrolase 13, mitochondrial isoform X2 [Rosa chinensis]PRQ54363.1 putative diadenosine hexaphosphate hydrolase (AMP-forming) [Rosa chinensis]